MDRRQGEAGGGLTTLLVDAAALGRRRVEITGSVHHHLFRARRLTVGERLRLVDGAGSARWARIVSIARATAAVRVEGPAPANEPPVRVELLAPAPRARRLAWMVEKATEVGVAAVRLIDCTRTPRRPGAASLERIRRIARSAMEQSHRSVLPEISGPHPEAEWPRLAARSSGCWLLAPGPRAEPIPATAPSIGVWVGPEGGWTEEELRRLRDLGCRPVSLGPSVLRIETAAVVGVALVACARDNPAGLR